MNRLRGILILLFAYLTPAVSAQLIYVGSITTSNSHRITVDNGTLGILDGGNLVLYDVSSPYHSQFLSTLSLPGQPQGLDISGNYVYIAAVDSGLIVVDIATPSNPQIIGRFIDTSPTTDLIVDDTICYLIDYSQLTILNIAIPSAPMVIANHDLPMVHNDAATLFDNMLYIVGDAGEFEFLFGIDVTNPAAPFRRSLGFEMWNVSDMLIADNRLFLTNPVWNYLSTFSIANPDSIIALGVLSLSGPTAIIEAGDLFYASRLDGGITELDCTDPDTSVVIDSVDTPGVSRDIASMDNYLFLADSNSIQIFWLFMDNTSNDATLPQATGMLSAYPDPFNAQTTISFTLDQSGPVTLEVFDLLGRKVATLIDGPMLAGEHQVVWDARNRASGAYYLSLRAGIQSATLRVTLLK